MLQSCVLYHLKLILCRFRICYLLMNNIYDSLCHIVLSRFALYTPVTRFIMTRVFNQTRVLSPR